MIVMAAIFSNLRLSIIWYIAIRNFNFPWLLFFGNNYTDVSWSSSIKVMIHLIASLLPIPRNHFLFTSQEMNDSLLNECLWKRWGWKTIVALHNITWETTWILLLLIISTQKGQHQQHNERYMYLKGYWTFLWCKMISCGIKSMRN